AAPRRARDESDLARAEHSHASLSGLGILRTDRIRGMEASVDAMPFEIMGELTDIEMIAVGDSLRELARLRRAYGFGRWRKLKGTAVVRLADGTVCVAEVHWYEAHGIGKREEKIKRILWDEP
ncbi:MAG: hypothetical protein V1772_01820, partial [Chloroflexota bacterium]